MLHDNKDKTYGITDELRESLLRYAVQKIETGSFLRSILENDLFEAIGRADMFNMRDKVFYDVCNYIYNELPETCWGSKEKVATWLGEN